MRFRNPERLPNGDIDCEVEHPVHGWVPFTASANDVEPYGVLIHGEAGATNPPDKVMPVLPTAAEELSARIDKRVTEVMTMAELLGVTADPVDVRAKVEAKVV